MRFSVAAYLFVAPLALLAQENYEIQVYGYETVPPGRTMVEIHSNLTVQGTKAAVDGVRPTNHAWHETVEITHGFTPWFETALYIFTSVQPDTGWSWVGTHIRPRFRAPASWHLPVGLSLSQEFGYQRRIFSTNTWTWEIRPVVDRELGRWYFSFNPTLERAIKGADAHRGFEFSPNFKASYSFTKLVAGGLEYYGSLGPLSNFDPLREQQQQIMPAIDLNFGPNWEFNLAVGMGITPNTNRLLVKMILGYRFSR